MYWEPAVELAEADTLRALQTERLNTTLAAARRAPHYAQALRNAAPARLERPEDLGSIPFTTKDDLRSSFPYGFLAVDRRDTVRLHSSSGTTGNPTVVFHTAADLDRWTDLLARCMYMTGVRREDVFQNLMSYGLFTGGLGFHYGAERIGALTIPIGPGNSQRQLWFMRQFETSVLHILPNYALRLAGLIAESGIDCRRELRLRIAFLGAEPHTEQMRRLVEETLGLRAYNSYGLSEMCGPGVAFECTEQRGMHVWEDAFYPEIIDPETLEPAAEGEVGELVLTTLSREAMPLLRYRTRDLTRFLPGPCPCGRTHRRIDRITGRSDDMLIINGVNIFPMQIEQVLLRIPGLGANYLVVVRTEGHMDRLDISVEVAPSAFGGTLEELEALQRRVAEALRSEIVVTPTVHLVEAGSLPTTEGKAQRVRDERPRQGG